MNPDQQKSLSQSSFLKKGETKPSSKKLLTKDSSVFMSFDSNADVGYRSGEFSSQSIDDKRKSGSSKSASEFLKREHTLRFDSGLGSDVFSPLPSESDIYYPTEEEGFSKKKEKAGSLKSESNLIWQDIYNQDQDGDTILHVAVVEARSDVIFPLIQQAPHPDFLDICNDLCQTPLQLATLTGKSNIVRRLVVAGATLDIQNYYGNTALHIASKNGDLDCVQAILQPLEQEEIDDVHCPYNIYPEDNDLAPLINLKNYDGQTCIHLASMGGFKKVLECLHGHGANINDQEGKSGRTALHFAVENSNLELIQILVQKCYANIHARNYAGKTPIHIAFTLCKINPQKPNALAVFDFLKKYSAEKWEFSSSSESFSSDDIYVAEAFHKTSADNTSHKSN